MGGWDQLPNLQGEVDTDYVVTAQDNAHIILGSTSSVVTDTVINAVSADNASTASSFNADGTYIEGGDPAVLGFAEVGAGGGGNTLDGAYDQGGAGLGRAITGDAGAVTITVPDTSHNAALELTQDDTTNSPTALLITNPANGFGLDIQSTGFGTSLNIASSSCMLILKTKAQVLPKQKVSHHLLA